MRRVLAATLLTVPLAGCEDTTKLSLERATQHVGDLAKAATEDVREVRTGLPLGAKHLAALYAGPQEPNEDPNGARQALLAAREKVQDLRVAKSTFFALVDLQGVVVRSDQEQDRMATRPLVPHFSGLGAALGGKYVEVRGSMPEASGMPDQRKDGQWVAAQPVQVDGKVRGLYVTGWSWSSYAYRLEFKLRSDIRAGLASESERNRNEPLVYVCVVVDKDVFGAPVTPVVITDTAAKLELPSKVQAGAVYTQALELTGRRFGLAAARVPALGGRVAIAVLRSET